MAARRLIIVMVILLGVSTLLAAALPDNVRQAEDEETTSEGSTTGTKAAAAPKATDGTAKVNADPCKSAVRCFKVDADLKKISVVPLTKGDQLVLEVTSRTDDLIEIGGLGLVDVIGPHNPATFDILADQPGSYGITLVEAARTVGRIEVAKQAPSGGAPSSAPE